jgi:outer membrane immunogenic protein
VPRIGPLFAVILWLGLDAVVVGPAAAFTNDWNGAYTYIGAHVGAAGQSGSDWNYFNPNNGASFSLAPGGNLRAAGGLHGGYNWQLASRWLVGVEGDMSWTSLVQSRAVPTIGPGSFATMSGTNSWLASMRGRAGFIGWSKTLLYFTGGAAWANTDHTGHMTRIIGASTFVADAASTTTKTGWVAGGGAQWMINAHVMLGLEYLYYGLGDETLTGPIVPGKFLPVSFTWPNCNVQVARASLSYKF